MLYSTITGTNPYCWTLTDPRGGIILNRPKRVLLYWPCSLVLAFSVLVFSTLTHFAFLYFYFPYLHFPVLAISAPPTITTNLTLILTLMPGFINSGLTQCQPASGQMITRCRHRVKSKIVLSTFPGPVPAGPELARAFVVWWFPIGWQWCHVPVCLFCVSYSIVYYALWNYL